MSGRKYLALASLLLCCGSGLVAAAEAGAPTPPASALQAHTALTYNPLRRCPDLRIASEDDPDFAMVMFLVGPSGVPSHPSLASRSGSPELDAAAMSCVAKLRFQPATRAGDGTAVESWQEIRWKWAPAVHRSGADAQSQSPAVAPTSIAQGGGGATPPAASATSNVGEGQRASQTPNGAEVRVCIDAQGRLTGQPTLTRASGDPSFDMAAVEVAKSGSGLYRVGSVDGKTTAGCLQLTIAPGARP